MHPSPCSTPLVVDEPAGRLAAIRAAAERYAAEGHRVLAVAASTRDSAGELESGLRVLGLVALADPLRPSALPAVAAARRPPGSCRS